MPCKHEQKLVCPTNPNLVAYICWNLVEHPKRGMNPVSTIRCMPDFPCKNYKEVDPNQLVRDVARVAAKLFGDD